MARIDMNSILGQGRRYVIYNKPSGERCDGNGPFSVITNLRKLITSDFRFVHRLDRHVTGAMLIANDANAANILRKAFDKTSKSYLVTRRYVGLLNGEPKLPKLGRIELEVPVYRDGKQMEPKMGITDYLMLSPVNGVTPVVFQLCTGRKNQIRSHCIDYFGVPLVNDVGFRDFQKGQGSGEVTPGQIGLHLGYLRVGCDGEIQNEVLAPIPKGNRKVWENFLEGDGYLRRDITRALLRD